MTVVPSESRHTIEDDGEKLRITIPARKRRYPILATGLGLVWIIIFLPVASRSFLDSADQGESWLPYALLAMFVFACISAIGILAWLLFGVEVVKVDSTGIKTRRQALGLGRTREYDGDHIRRLRAAPIVYATTYQSNFTWEYLGLAGGQIAFDYGAKTIRFGGGLDEAEARMIVETILQRFHRYQHK